MNEDQLVGRLIQAGWRGSRDVTLGPGDDAAVLRGGLVASTDMMVEGVHFRFDWISAREAGFRAGAAALSDMAAMGARPVALLVSMALPGDPAVGVEMQRGARRAGDRVGVAVAGGDVSRTSGPAVVDVTALGRARQVVPRSGAVPGHELWVSGALGGAAAAVAAWSIGAEPLPGARECFVAPPNRVPLGRTLAREGLARSMIDISDGLLADARRIAAASGAKVVIREEAVPVDPVVSAASSSAGSSSAASSSIASSSAASPSAVRQGDLDAAVRQDNVNAALRQEDLNPALIGGEDYELMFTAEADSADRIRALGQELSLPITRVGTVEPGAGVALDRVNGRREFDGPGGWDHFAAPPPQGRRP